MTTNKGHPVFKGLQDAKEVLGSKHGAHHPIGQYKMGDWVCPPKVVHVMGKVKSKNK